MTDKSAIRRLKAGDITGLAELVQAYQQKAVYTAVLITRDVSLAEDVVQAAFIRVAERIHQFDDTRPFEPYFLRVVVNDATKAVTRSAPHLPLGEDFALPDPAPSPEALAERAEREAHIRALLARLTPQERAALVMRYYLGWSEAEMSDELGIPQGTIKWRLHSARKRLRGLLQGGF